MVVCMCGCCMNVLLYLTCASLYIRGKLISLCHSSTLHDHMLVRDSTLILYLESATIKIFFKNQSDVLGLIKMYTELLARMWFSFQIFLIYQRLKPVN